MLVLTGIIFILLLSNISTIEDSPLGLPSLSNIGDVRIIATLTNQLTGESYKISEYLSTSNGIHGKILIESDLAGQIVVFYSNDDTKRLVIHDSDCKNFNYALRSWSGSLSNVAGELENIILLMGPSIYFRIKNSNKFLPKKSVSKVRGVTVDASTTKLGSSLNVTVYQSQNTTQLQYPLRIEFQGFMSSKIYVYETQHTHLLLDFYEVEFDGLNIKSQVSVIPGIGCYEYLETYQTLPAIRSERLHFFVQKSSEYATVTNTFEIFLDPIHKLARSSSLNSNLFTIYDYNVGVKYSWAAKTCTLHPIVESDEGILKGQFNLNRFFELNGNFKYLGKIFYDKRSGIICDVWEYLIFNGTLDGLRFDKVVKTAYFVKKAGITGQLSESSVYTPVAVTVNAYKQVANSDTFELARFTRKDFYDFSRTIPEQVYENTHGIAECFSDKSQQLALTFDIRPTSSLTGNQPFLVAEKNLYKLRDSLNTFIANTETISPLRVVSIDFDFYSPEKILAEVAFIEKPPTSAGLTRKVIKIDSSLLTSAIKTPSLENCISYISMVSSSRKFIWCDSGTEMKNCRPVSEDFDTKSDAKNGVECILYKRNVGDVRRPYNELPLAKIHDDLLARKQNLILKAEAETGPRGTQWIFNIFDIFVSSQPQDVASTKVLFKRYFNGQTLNPNHVSVRKAEKSVKSLGSCWHLCEFADQFECHGFSYCEASNQCLVTSSPVDRVNLDKDLLIESSECNVWSKDNIFDYHQVKQRKFVDKVLIKGSQLLGKSPEDCAFKCSTQKTDCHSFQFCSDQNLCVLLDQPYLTQLTEKSIVCEIYHPKRIKEFTITGNDLIQDITSVEIDLNLEQCASLCYHYSSTNKGCKSFNYCPKGTTVSSCQISDLTQSMASGKTLKNANCLNYELTPFQRKRSNADNSHIYFKKSGPLITGIFLTCLFVGLIFGFVVQVFYIRWSKGLAAVQIVSRTIRWTRHSDEPENAVQTGLSTF